MGKRKSSGRGTKRDESSRLQSGETSRTPPPPGPRIYELEVALLEGRITEEFAEQNPVVSRTIQIRGEQTLEVLHEAIFEAFDRFDEHLFEFQVGGKKPMDPKARRYVLPMADDPYDEDRPAGLVTDTTLDDLDLKKGQSFGYWFDFGDDWWHQVALVAVHEGAGAGKFPRVTARVGDSPPQYPGLDEDEDEEGDEDEEDAVEDDGEIDDDGEDADDDEE